jgi:RNA polymerase sigma factor (sigma-70 family)
MAEASTLEQVLRVAGARLTAYGYVLTGSQSDAEELVQEAVVKTFVRRPRLDNAAAAEQYVRLAMKTTMIDRARKAERFRKRAPMEVQPDTTPDAVVAISHRVAVSKALEQLSTQQRVAVALRYWDDLTVPEIAASMRVRPGTVKRYLFDAANSLRPLLGDHVEPEDNDIRVVGLTQGRSKR